MANSNAEKKPRGPGRPFVPGQVANPTGRPIGSRNKLGEDFVAALQTDFKQHGVAVIERVRNEKPDAYLKVIAQVIPKEFHIRDDTMDHMSDDELINFLAAVRQANARAGRAEAAARTAKKDGEPGPDSVH